MNRNFKDTSGVQNILFIKSSPAFWAVVDVVIVVRIIIIYSRIHIEYSIYKRPVKVMVITDTYRYNKKNYKIIIRNKLYIFKI